MKTMNAIALSLFTLAFAGYVRADGFQFDTSRLAVTPKAELPQERMSLRAFESAPALRALPTEEKVEKSERLSRSRIADFTTSWRVERDPKEGELLIAANREAAGGVGETEEAKLREMSIGLLGRIGVPQAEIGRVLVRSLVTSDADGKDDPTTPQLLFSKTFVTREINGVPVEGHRGVISYSPGGSLHRANLLWPAIASTGHKLATKLSIQQITERASEVLKREGEREGKVLLRWKYVPVKQATGEVALQLAVGARIQSKPGTEPREITVPVDAF
jgi:hypothetical protein